MEIVIEGPSFYGAEDENVFFNCIYSLPEYNEVIGNGLNLHVRLNDPLSDATIEQLVVIYKRWKISPEPLSPLKRESNIDFPS